jgi:hypothetical protein
MDGNNTAAVGRHWQTQLAIAVAFLKQHNAPIRLEDLAIRSGVEHLLTNPELQQGLRQHDRVRFDERTQLVSYKVRLAFLSLENYSPTLTRRPWRAARLCPQLEIRLDRPPPSQCRPGWIARQETARVVVRRYERDRGTRTRRQSPRHPHRQELARPQ